MKHLLVVTTSFPKTHDGSEAAGSFVYDLACVLSKRVRVTVVAPGDAKCREEISPYFDVHRFPAPRKPLSLLKIYHPLHWIDILKILFFGKKKVEEIVGQKSVDHILALWVLPSGFWAKKASEMAGIPYSTWALGSDIWTLGKIPVVKRVLRDVLLASSTNYADGFNLRESVEKISGRECSFLPSARKLDVPKYKVLPQGPPYRLTFLGRWHKNKGIDILLDALFLLNEFDWQLIREIRIFGGGPLSGYVNNKVKLLSEKGFPVHLGGFIDKKESIGVLNCSDYVMIPSRIESIPLIFSDSMKCKCPVVCSPAGDLKKFVLDYNVGVVSDGFSSQNFCVALQKIIRNKPDSYMKKINDVANLFCLEKISDGIINN